MESLGTSPPIKHFLTQCVASLHIVNQAMLNRDDSRLADYFTTSRDVVNRVLKECGSNSGIAKTDAIIKSFFDGDSDSVQLVNFTTLDEVILKISFQESLFGILLVSTDGTTSANKWSHAIGIIGHDTDPPGYILIDTREMKATRMSSLAVECKGQLRRLSVQSGILIVLNKPAQSAVPVAEEEDITLPAAIEQPPSPTRVPTVTRKRTNRAMVKTNGKKTDFPLAIPKVQKVEETPSEDAPIMDPVIRD